LGKEGCSLLNLYIIYIHFQTQTAGSYRGEKKNSGLFNSENIYTIDRKRRRRADTAAGRKLEINHVPSIYR
jgi:hypothetical protein